MHLFGFIIRILDNSIPGGTDGVNLLCIQVAAKGKNVALPNMSDL